MTAQEANVAHHAKLEDPCDLISSTGSENLPTRLFEKGFGYGVLVPMESGEAAAGPRIP
jgi:hypothetical protein